jgi:hypothetical protein
MKRIIRLTEHDLARIVRRVINENENPFLGCFDNTQDGFTVPPICLSSKTDIYACKKQLQGMNPKYPNDEKMVLDCINKKLKETQDNLSFLKKI